MTRYLSAGLGILLALALFACALLDARYQAQRGRANTLAEQVAARDAALAQEKAATAEALGAADSIGLEKAREAQRYENVETQLNAELARYRAMLGKCQSPDALIERGGRLFPAPVSP